MSRLRAVHVVLCRTGVGRLLTLTGIAILACVPVLADLPYPEPPPGRIPNLSAPRRLSPIYRGAARSLAAVKQGRMPARALAKADFDEDGMPDLLVAHAGADGRGAVALHRGSVDAVYPNQPEARRRRADGQFTDAPFLRDVAVFDAAEAPDFIGAGDFDADGHWDAVTARLGGRALFWHRGNGKGSLGPAQRIDLPGPVTAFAIGDVNRRDGLDDVVVAVDGPHAARLLVFEGPVGALAGPPEEIAVAGSVSTIALGQMDEDDPIDLVVTSGSSLQIVRGRDRRLSLDEKRRGAVKPAAVTTMALPFAVESVAVGEFDDTPGPDIALLDTSLGLSVVGARALLEDAASAMAGLSPRSIASEAGGVAREPIRLSRVKASNQQTDDLVLLAGASILMSRTIDPQGHRGFERIQALGPVRDIVAMRLGPEAPDGLVLALEGEALPSFSRSLPLGTFTVTNTNDGGSGSLRQALLDASATFPSPASIVFDIPGAAPHVIQPLTELIVERNVVALDATTNPDYAGTPVVQIDGTLNTIDRTGLVVTSGTVRGLVVTGFGEVGLLVLGGVVEGNFIGTDPSGSSAGPAQWMGIECHGDNVTIGGTVEAARNLIGGHPFAGITAEGSPLCNNLTVRGNSIGVDVTGTASIPNREGLRATLVSGLVVGGTAPGAGNLFCNSIDDISMLADSALLQGNHHGTNRAGTAALPGEDGIDVWVFGNDNTIGGTTPAARNIMASNFAQIAIDEIGSMAAMDNLVQGNYLGLAADGHSPLGHAPAGVSLRTGTNNVVGGSTPGAMNVISGNGNGVEMTFRVGPVAYGSNAVQGNRIGTDATGLIAVPNDVGVFIDTPDNLIGGFSPAEGNLISGNGTGVVLVNDRGLVASNNVLASNLIGSDVTGALPLANVDAGVLIDGVPLNVIGLGAGQGNIIADNGTGVVIQGSTAQGNVLYGNRIVSNGLGVLVRQGASGNTLGGSAGVTGSGNVISGNTAQGVLVAADAGSGNLLVGNSIGTNLPGTAAFPNAIGVELDAPGNAIGDGSLADRNVISGNETIGVLLGSFDIVVGNYIGTTFDGTAPLGNGASGILISSGPLGGFNEIGRATPGGGNVIAYNGGDGIGVAPGSLGGQVSANSVHDNGGLGIDLGGDGVTANDPGDPDTGANTLQNTPVLTSATTTGGSVTVGGFLDSTPLTTFSVDFFASPSCDPSGSGEGRTYLGHVSATTGPAGTPAAASGGFIGAVNAGDAITATATSPDHDTSEFSACMTAAGVAPSPVSGLMAGLANGSESVSWTAVPGAIRYHTYVGTRSTQAGLATQALDSCEAVVTQSPGFTIPPAGDPPVGEMFWIQVAAEGPYGEGSVGSGNPGPRILDSTGTCTTSCAHDPCTTGSALIPACSLCSSIVCAKDPACCAANGAWSPACVQEMRTVCGSLLCPEAQGQCAHSLCDDSSPLVSGCDAPPLPKSCTASICQVDPHCCQQAWDEACIAKVASVCHQNCL